MTECVKTKQGCGWEGNEADNGNAVSPKFPAPLRLAKGWQNRLVGCAESEANGGFPGFVPALIQAQFEFINSDRREGDLRG